MVGIIATILASVTGYALRQEGGYEEPIVDKHQYLAITTIVISILVYFFRSAVKIHMTSPSKRKQVRVLLFIPLIILVSATGHFGGSLTHGEDYLFSVLGENVGAPKASDQIKTIANSQEAILYKDVVSPILQEKCYGCHSAKKQKGDLRLDGEKFILDGGKHGEVIVTGLPDSSSLYKRLILPLEDKKHMPPKEKPQLTSAEIDLIKIWIGEGADFNIAVSKLSNRVKVEQSIRALQYMPEAWFPSEPAEEADENAVQKLRSLGVLVVEAGNESNYLTVNFINSRDITQEKISLLEKLNPQIVSLTLSGTNISDEQLQIMRNLEQLRVLYLNNTKTTDPGVSYLRNLKDISYLNLVGTSVTDKSLEYLSDMKRLKNVFLYNTKVTRSGIFGMSKDLKGVNIDTGSYKLPILASDTIKYKRTPY